MYEIDLTQIDNYEDTYENCDKALADAIWYIRNTIIPFLGNFTEVDKQDQSIRINEITNFNADLVHLVKTVHNLDINKGASQHYHIEETQESGDSDNEIQCVP